MLAKFLAYFRRSGTGSALAVLGVAIGAANIVALISVTDSARRQAHGIMRDMGADTVMVLPFVDKDEARFMQANSAAFLPVDFLPATKSSTGIEAAIGVLMIPGYVSTDLERWFTIIEGTEPDYPAIRGHGVESGRFLTAQDGESHARVCCLGHGLDKKLLGDIPPVGAVVSIKGLEFEVVGTMIEKGMAGLTNIDDRVFIPLTTAQELFGVDGYHVILSKVKQDVNKNTARDLLRDRLYGEAGVKEDSADFTVATMDDMTSLIGSTLNVFRVLLYGVSSVALLVAGIGIMNVMLMQVMERTREIGIRRATGARRRDIWLQFLAEAVGQAAIGAVVGLLLGSVAAWAFCLIVGWQLYIAPLTIALSMGVSLLTGIFFGVFPASHAARMKPIDCLRYE